MALWLGGDCEKLTAHTDRGRHYGRNQGLHKAASPFREGSPSCPGDSILQAGTGSVKEEGEEMSEEQKKKIDGVLHEMKHMNPQQIEVMITYMQGMATAAKLMQEERKEA